MKLDEAALPLELTAIELCYLTDAINNFDHDEGEEEEQLDGFRPLARHLLLKLGSLFLQLVQPDALATGAATVYVTEPEAWLLRGKAKTTSMYAKEMVGVPLLRKLYNLLLRFQEAIPACCVLVDEPGEEEEGMKRARLAGWKYSEEYKGADRSPD